MSLTSPLEFALSTIFLLLAGSLAMLFSVGVICYQTGMVQRKNVLDTLAKGTILLAISTMAFLAVGYSAIHTHNPGPVGFIPLPHVGFNTLAFLFRSDNPYNDFAGFFFQLMLANGAIAILNSIAIERINPGVSIGLGLVFTLAIYPWIGHWTLGNGMLQRLGFIDAAGAGLVHLSAAACVFVSTIVLGARNGRIKNKKVVQSFPANNFFIVSLGVFLIWIGSLGINSGAAFAETTIANANVIAKIFSNTYCAATAGLLVSWAISRLTYGKTDLTIILNGAICGTVAIAAVANLVNISAAAIIGAIASFVSIVSLLLLNRTRFDDPTGTFAIHGIAAICGLIAASFFNPHMTWYQQLPTQLLGILLIFGWSGGITLITLIIIRLLTGIRISHIEEQNGLDQCYHAMRTDSEKNLFN